MLGRTSREVSVVDIHSFLFFISFLNFILLLLLLLFILLLFFISFPSCFSMSPAFHPGFSGPWRPPPAVSSNLDYFWLPLLFHLMRALWFWVGVFYSQAFFTLRSFTNIFDSTCIYQGLPGSRQFFLEVCGAHTDDPRNTNPAHLFLWFTVIHNLHTQNDSFLNSTIY